MTHRTTFTLDAETIRRLKRLAARWDVSQAEVVRRAIAQAEAKPQRSDPVAMLRELQKSGEAIDPKEAAAYAKFMRIENAGEASDLSGYQLLSRKADFLRRPADAHARQHKAQPWSVPRLRGRGEQGNILMHT